MKLNFVTVDVFTDRQFGGNPLAVITDAQGLSNDRMQAIAAEFNLAETTFVLPPKDQAHTAEVRIFTPKAEMPFAGHPNVGTAFVLARAGTSYGRPVGGDRLVFEEKAGLVAMDIVRGRELWTSTSLYSFKGITQQNVIDAWRAAGNVAKECDFTLAQVYSADEAFVTGTLGGEPGQRGSCRIFRANGTVEELKSKAALDLGKGDIVEMFVGGGAGFGRVVERPDAMIERDLADGLLTRDPRSARKLAAE